MISNDALKQYVEENIRSFHQARLASLRVLKIETLLRRKNPYLFRCKNILTASDFVKLILDAHLIAQEETLFGNFIEGVAIFVNSNVYGGRKSSAEGIDLEFTKDNAIYIVSIKSGPNWGNSSQIKKMINNFSKAQRILRTGGNSTVNVIAVNGCCYGKDGTPDKGTYFKYCGQRFWELMSGENSFYTKLIEPLGHQAKERNEEFIEEYARIENIMVEKFMSDFCHDGKINWDQILQYNSGA